MPVNTCENITLGLGDLYVNGQLVGWLKNKVDYQYEYDVKKFKSGVPKKLQCKIVAELTASLKAGVAEMNAENLSRALGQLPVSTITSGTVTVSTAETHTPVLDPTTGKYWCRLGSGAGRANTFATVVVKDITATTTYVANTDYTIDAATGILEIVSGGAIVAGDSLKVTYGYHTIAGKKIALGATFTLNNVEIAFVHTKPNGGKKVWIVMWLAAVTGKIGLSFDEENFIVNDMEFEAVEDTSHSTEPFGYIFIES